MPATGPYYVRVLALDPSGAPGAPSAALMITTVTTVTVTPATASIAAGATQPFTPTAKDAQNNTVTGLTFYWASSDPTVATVDPASGVATGKAGGSAKITALGLGIPGNATLTVTAVALTFTVVDAGGGRDTPFASEGDFTCGVTSAGAVYCWGGNGKGQLGDGSTTRRLIPVLALAPAGVTFSSVSTGWRHTCAVTVTPVVGDVYCWGRNENGRLGDGTQGDRSVPGRVAAPSGITFLSVSAGGQHTCGVAAGTRDIYCWGRNSSGQVGDATTTDRFTPVRVSAPAGVIFNSVTAGGEHSCAVATTGAVAYCWGANSSGQLGDSTNTLKNAPVRVKPPTATSVLFAAVTAGEQHTCGRTTSSIAWCWGQNANGQLGDNTVVSKNGPAAVQQGALVFAEVSAGNQHTCARTSAGAGYCWGKNAYGQLGDGSLSDNSVPTLTQGGLTLSRSAGGAQHTCGLATGTSAGVWCWGLNEDGQLGDGTTISRVQPVRTVQ